MRLLLIDTFFVVYRFWKTFDVGATSSKNRTTSNVDRSVRLTGPVRAVRRAEGDIFSIRLEHQQREAKRKKFDRIRSKTCMKFKLILNSVEHAWGSKSFEVKVF